MKTGIVTLLLIITSTFSHLDSTAQVMNVRKWRSTERDSLDNALFLADEKLFLHALPIFQNLLNQHPEETFLKYSYGRTALHRSDRHADAYRLLSEVSEKNQKIPEINYELALAAHYNNRFGEAEQYLARCFAQKSIPPELRSQAERLKVWIANAYVHYAKPTRAKISNLGDQVNSPDDEYVPTITADESLLMFTYAGPLSTGGRQNAFMQEDFQSGIFMEDIFLSRRENDRYGKAIPVDSLNTRGPDAAVSLSADGQTLFLFKDEGDGHGDLYQSTLSGENFTPPVRLKGEVNSYSWDGHCSLSPDGRTLYFSSERSGGKGGRDIYRASLSSDSSWTNIVNLGDSVNTPFDDDAPFIHADGVTLFFSSKGRNTMGGYDIYRTVMGSDSAFRSTEHLGYPINSTADDIYFVLAANGKNAYYSSGRKEGLGMKDIYLVEPKFTTGIPSVYLVKGTVTLDDKPSSAKLISVSASGVSVSAQANSASGKYLLALRGGVDHTVHFSCGELPRQTFTLGGSKLKGYNEKVLDVKFMSAKDTLLAAAPPPAPPVAAPVPPESDGFVPRNKLHEKSMRYIVKNGDVSAAGLVFKVQVAALRNTGRYYLPHLTKYGRVEKMKAGDGLTRLMMGSFKTLRKAFAYNKKIVKAGQSDAFVTAVLNGNRVTFEELVKQGVFVSP
jgi:hypothetical protein